MTKLNPYINFKNNAREAMEFYKTVFGGNLTISTFKDFQSPEMPVEPDEVDNVMHSVLEVENGIMFMASDTPKHMENGAPVNSNMSMSLSGENEEELRGYWDKLSEGGQVTMPMDKAPWGDSFGMLTDKFGINWMVNITGPKPQA